jgi:hypothetical protein
MTPDNRKLNFFFTKRPRWMGAGSRVGQVCSLRVEWRCMLRNVTWKSSTMPAALSPKIANKNRYL